MTRQQSELGPTLPREPKTAGLRRVLVVDDYVEYAARLRRSFEDAGFDARAVNDGDVALTEVAAWQPDLLVLDVCMPKTDGIDVLRQLRVRSSIEEWIPVILITGDTRETIDLAALVYSADALIRKPCSHEKIVERAREMLAGTWSDD